MASKTLILNGGQQQALLNLLNFVNDPSKRIFILKGYAGTGKTTLMRMFIERIRKNGWRNGALLDDISAADVVDDDGLIDERPAYYLLASTGRAAKILSNITKEVTSTVHGMIYQYVGFNKDLERIVEEREKTGVDASGQLLLLFGNAGCEGRTEKHIYIIDEASMVADEADRNPTQAVFGTGRLLHDLLQYDRDGKFIFVGDACQLPPVSQTNSPALTADYFKRTYQIDAEQVELTEVVRQEKGNDIVVGAQRLRHLYYAPQPWKWAKFPLKGCNNIHLINNEIELLQRYIGDIKRHGYNFSTLITQSNRKCYSLTSIIRPSLGINSPTIAVNDLLLVTQNNLISGLMNGDLVKVTQIGEAVRRRAGLTFLCVSVEELFTHKVYTLLMISEILYSNLTNLSQVQQKELFIDFHIRMKEIYKAKFIKEMKEKGIEQGSKKFLEAENKAKKGFKAFEDDEMRRDPYLNALRCVYGYVLTCHKSQGGEWDNVYLDIPRSLPLQPKPYVYQWVYTAMTRAKKELYVTNDFYII